MNGNKVIKGILWAILGVGVALLYIYAFMLLWNWLIPCLFDGPSIQFIHAAGIILLSKMLFGFGFGGSCKCKCGGHRSRWKEKFYNKWECIPDEEKEKWKEKLKNCFEDDKGDKPDEEKPA